MKLSNQIRGYINLGIIGIVLIGVISGVGFVGYKIYKSKQKDQEIIELKTQVKAMKDEKEKENDSYVTEADLDSIRRELNAKGFHTMFTDTIELKHAYKFIKEQKLTDTESFFGADVELTIGGFADAQYQYGIDTKDIKLEAIENTNIVRILLPEPKMDTQTVKRVDGSFRKDEENSGSNAGANLHGGDVKAEAMRLWEDSFDKNAPVSIKAKLDKDNKKIEEIRDVCKEGSESLANTFNINKDIKYKIEYIKGE